MSGLRKLYRGDNNFDFLPLWKRSVPISGALALISIVLLLVVGVNASIDFQGGGVWEVPVDSSVTVAEGRDAVTEVSDARIQIVDDPDGGTFLRVQTGTEGVDKASEIVAELAAFAEVEPDDVSQSTVGPTWGSQITGKAIRALAFFFVAVAAYLAWTLEWRMAVGAIIAVVHDLAITAGAYAAFQFEVSPATVIALLTILGYSIYDTVVVYDKVLENSEDPALGAIDYTSMVNKSMNQVLMRSINTTITTVLPVASMLFIGGFLLGGSTLQGFALALFIGLILGTYSSVFLAAPALAWLKERDPEIGVRSDRIRERQRIAAIKQRESEVAEKRRFAPSGQEARPRKKRSR